MFQRSWTNRATWLGVAVSILAAPGCRASRPGEAREVVPELKLDGVRFRVYRGADLRAIGDAATVTLRRDSSEIAAREVEVELLGQRPARITAPAGEGTLQSSAFSASGGVVLASGDDIARTERARFDGAEGVVRGDDPVAVEGRGYRLTGTGFELDPAKGELTVRGKARLVARAGGAR